MDTVIRPFFEATGKPGFLEKIVELDGKAFGEENKWDYRNFTSELPLKKELSFAVFYDNRPIGYIIGSAYHGQRSKIAHVNRIAVAREPDIRGTGRRLVSEFEIAARENGCVSATLEFDSDLDVSGFYEKLGYMPLQQNEDIKKYVAVKNKQRSLQLYISMKRKIYFKDLTK